MNPDSPHLLRSETRPDLALLAFQNKLTENEEMYVHTPVSLMTQIRALGKAYPTLYPDIKRLMEGLKKRSITMEPSQHPSEGVQAGIQFLQTFLHKYIPRLEDEQFDILQEYLKKMDQSEASETESNPDLTLEAFLKKLSENEDLYGFTPLGLITQIRALGTNHPALYPEIKTLLEGLKSKPYTYTPSMHPNERIRAGIRFLQSYLENFVATLTVEEFKRVQESLEKLDQTEIGQSILDILVQNEDAFLNSPDSFADQINILHEITNILSLEQKIEILDILAGLKSFDISAEKPQKTSQDKKIAQLKELAQKIHKANVEPYILSSSEQTAIKKEIQSIHEEYKKALTSKMNYASQLAAYYWSVIPITDIDTSSYLPLLPPEGRDLNPDNPRNIPRLFENDVLNENSLGKTRSSKHVYIFKKQDESDATISYPKTRKEALPIIRQAKELAKKVLPPNAPSDEIFRMRNHILAMCSQHTGNMLTAPLLTPLNYNFHAKGHPGSLTISRPTFCFEAVIKNGVLQKNQFKVTYKAPLHLIVTLPELLHYQAETSVKKYCLTFSPFATVTAEFIVHSDYDDAHSSKVSVSDVNLQYGLTNHLIP